MKEFTDKLVKELSVKHINWIDINKIIIANKNSINKFDDRDSALSHCFHYLYNRGKVALRLTELFLDNGFDVTANEGKNGASCLFWLCYTLYDKYIPEIAEILLRAGSPIHNNYCYRDGELEDVIASKFIYWYEEDSRDCANTFESYYMMVYRYNLGKAYKGIRSGRDSVSVKINKVYRIIEQDGTVKVILCSDDIMLEIRDDVVLLVNPYAFEGHTEIYDETEKYSMIVNSKIRGFRFKSPMVVKLSFDNGKYLQFSHRESEGFLIEII